MALESAPLLWWPLLGIVGGTLLVCVYAFIISLFLFRAQRSIFSDVVSEEDFDSPANEVDRINPFEMTDGDVLFAELQRAKGIESSDESDAGNNLMESDAASPVSRKNSAVSEQKEKHQTEEKSRQEENVGNPDTAGGTSPSKTSDAPNDGLGKPVALTEVLFLSNPTKMELNVKGLRSMDPFPRLYRLPPIPGAFPEGLPSGPTANPFAVSGDTGATSLWGEKKNSNTAQPKSFAGRAAADGGNTIYKPLPKFKEV